VRVQWWITIIRTTWNGTCTIRKTERGERRQRARACTRSLLGSAAGSTHSVGPIERCTNAPRSTYTRARAHRCVLRGAPRESSVAVVSRVYVSSPTLHSVRIWMYSNGPTRGDGERKVVWRVSTPPYEYTYARNILLKVAWLFSPYVLHVAAAASRAESPFYETVPRRVFCASDWTRRNGFLVLFFSIFVPANGLCHGRKTRST